MTVVERAPLASIAEWLRDSVEELAVAQVAVVRKSFPSYARIPDEELLRSSRRNVIRVAETLEGQDELPAEISESEMQSAQYRALQGVPAEDVAKAYRAVVAVVRDAFFARASAEGVPFDVILAGTQRLWAMTDRLSDRLTSARHDIELEVARREERQRLDFLQQVLSGNLLASEMLHVGSAHGLHADHRYWVFRARHLASLRASDGTFHAGDSLTLSRHLERSCADDRFAPIVGPVDADLAGLARKRPTPPDDGSVVLATVGPVEVADLPHAWAEATRLLNVAVKYGRRGLVDSESLSIRIAVVQESELGEALYNRYVAKVLADSRMAEVLLESVRVFLDRKRSAPDAAEALNIHTNTLRYRLERFEAITGVDLTDTETIIKVWWALEYWYVQRDRRG
ncbi:MAG: PucR family transcriptional regulator [Sporichthyaceae bacterium]